MGMDIRCSVCHMPLVFKEEPTNIIMSHVLNMPELVIPKDKAKSLVAMEIVEYLTLLHTGMMTSGSRN